MEAVISWDQNIFHCIREQVDERTIHFWCLLYSLMALKLRVRGLKILVKQAKGRTCRKFQQEAFSPEGLIINMQTLVQPKQEKRFHVTTHRDAGRTTVCGLG